MQQLTVPRVSQRQLQKTIVWITTERFLTRNSTWAALRDALVTNTNNNLGTNNIPNYSRSLLWNVADEKVAKGRYLNYLTEFMPFSICLGVSINTISDPVFIVDETQQPESFVSRLEDNLPTLQHRPGVTLPVERY